MKKIILLFTLPVIIFLPYQMFSQNHNPSTKKWLKPIVFPRKPPTQEFISFNYDKSGNQKMHYKLAYITYNAKKISKKESAKKNFKVYPNPTHNNITVDWSQEGSKTLLAIKVYSSQGQLVEMFKIKKRNLKQKISFFNYSSGVYFITAEFTDATSETEKIIKL